MKVMQTLGRHGGVHEGIFKYKRTSAGVEIDTTIGQSNQKGTWLLSHSEWTMILTTIGAVASTTLRISPSQSGNPPNAALYDLIGQAIPQPAAGWTWHDSIKACVVAILEHEGSIDLYHGTLGGLHTAFICLQRDY